MEIPNTFQRLQNVYKLEKKKPLTLLNVAFFGIMKHVTIELVSLG